MSLHVIHIPYTYTGTYHTYIYTRLFRTRLYRDVFISLTIIYLPSGVKDRFYKRSRQYKIVITLHDVYRWSTFHRRVKKDLSIFALCVSFGIAYRWIWYGASRAETTHEISRMQWYTIYIYSNSARNLCTCKIFIRVYKKEIVTSCSISLFLSHIVKREVTCTAYNYICCMQYYCYFRNK